MAKKTKILAKPELLDAFLRHDITWRAHIVIEALEKHGMLKPKDYRYTESDAWEWFENKPTNRQKAIICDELGYPALSNF